MMTKELERRLAEAVDDAKQMRHEFVTLEHILLSLCESPLTNEILQGCGANVQKLKKDLRVLIKKHCPQISAEQIGLPPLVSKGRPASAWSWPQSNH